MSTPSLLARASEDVSGLGKLLGQARHFQRLDRLLAPSLGPDLRPHCQVACQRGDALVLLARNAAWASRCRMQAPELLRALHRAGHGEISSIKIRVAPLPAQGAAQRAPRQLSPAARQSLKRFSDATENAELAAIAARLAARVSGGKGPK